MIKVFTKRGEVFVKLNSRTAERSFNTDARAAAQYIIHMVPSANTTVKIEFAGAVANQITQQLEEAGFNVDS